MSSTKKLGPGGKDTVIFATKEDHQKPSTVTLPPPEFQPGLLLPNGEINWNCPCLGGIATGPCGVEFRTAFTCFHYSAADPKGEPVDHQDNNTITVVAGSDCVEKFNVMRSCMSNYPTLYHREVADDDDFSALEADGQNMTPPPESDTSGKKE